MCFLNFLFVYYNFLCDVLCTLNVQIVCVFMGSFCARSLRAISKYRDCIVRWNTTKSLPTGQSNQPISYLTTEVRRKFTSVLIRTLEAFFDLLEDHGYKNIYQIYIYFFYLFLFSINQFPVLHFSCINI